jgi:hypothetical protein
MRIILISLFIIAAPALARNCNDGSTNQRTGDETISHWEELDLSQAAPGYWSNYSNGQRFFHHFHLYDEYSHR